MKNAIVIAALVLSACASTTENIKPVANAGKCTNADRARLAALSQQQNTTAKQDTIGVILIGVPVGSMGSRQHEAEIALLKGRCEK